MPLGSPVSLRPVNPSVNFKGYSNMLKTLYREGKFPAVKKGFYGGDLSQANVSLEHIERAGKDNGGTILGNLVLVTDRNNRKRGCKDIKEFYSETSANEYLMQFKDLIIGTFNGNSYIELIKKRLSKLNLNI